jgi:hypothetical protein
VLGEAHPATQQATRALAATREAAASWSKLWPTELQSLWPSIRAFGDLAGLGMPALNGTFSRGRVCHYVLIFI